MKMDRRQFARLSAGAALGAGGLSSTGCSAREEAPPKAKAAPRALVARARDAAVRVQGEQFDAAKLRAMLDRAVMQAANQKEPNKAWRELFSPKDVVGLKVNCLAGRRLSSHPVVVGAIVKSLVEAGVPEGNIIVWERFERELTRAGFRIQKNEGGVRVMATEGEYDDAVTISGETGSCYAPFVSRLCTALINVPVLKDHRLAGVGVGLKNFFGAINNPNKYHPTGKAPHACDPYLADVNNCPLIRDKLRLVVCDALNGQCDGGPTLRPQALWEENGLLVATDPVALDAVAWGILEERRKERGLPTLEAAGRPPKWLKTASAHGLGEHDPARIAVADV